MVLARWFNVVQLMQSWNVSFQGKVLFFCCWVTGVAAAFCPIALVVLIDWKPSLWLLNHIYTSKRACCFCIMSWWKTNTSRICTHTGGRSLCAHHQASHYRMSYWWCFSTQNPSSSTILRRKSAYEWVISLPRMGNVRSSYPSIYIVKCYIQPPNKRAGSCLLKQAEIG